MKKVKFDKERAMLANMIEANDIANRNIAVTKEANKVIAERNKIEKDRLEYETKTKDRVDISLNEYLSMKEMLAKQANELGRYKAICDRLQIKDLNFNKIETFVVNDPAELSTKYTIRLTYKNKIRGDI